MSKMKLPRVFLSENTISNRVKELGLQISQDFQGEDEIIVICTLKGSVVFFSDLIRSISLPLRCEFLGVSSYGDHTKSTGQVKVTLDLHEPIEGKAVLLVEDIVDSGLTLSYLSEYLRTRKPKTIKTCSLLFKPDALKAKNFALDYIGFSISNEFVVGYGLDYAQHYRNLPYVGVYEP